MERVRAVWGQRDGSDQGKCYQELEERCQPACLESPRGLPQVLQPSWEEETGMQGRFLGSVALPYLKAISRESAMTASLVHAGSPIWLLRALGFTDSAADKVIIRPSGDPLWNHCCRGKGVSTGGLPPAVRPPPNPIRNASKGSLLF